MPVLNRDAELHEEVTGNRKFDTPFITGSVFSATSMLAFPNPGTFKPT